MRIFLREELITFGMWKDEIDCEKNKENKS